jgi:transcriptional regulator with XRE-family HTH domain
VANPNVTPKISRAEMERMRRAGFRIREIAERAGVSRQTMGAYLRGINPDPGCEPLHEPRLRKEVPDNIAEILERLYWLENKSQQDIASELGETRSTIARWFKHFGITQRSRSEAIKLAYKQDPLRKPTPPVPTHDQAVAAAQASVEARREAGTLKPQLAKAARNSAKKRAKPAPKKRHIPQPLPHQKPRVKKKVA